MSPTYVIGDIHGHYERLIQVMQKAGLIGSDLAWRANGATLCFVGDFFDRGPDGISAVELAIRLEDEARAAGGRVMALIGNHDLMIMAAHRFGSHETSSPRGTFTADWLAMGGRPHDLERLQPAHIEWLSGLPGMAHLDGRLVVHADALFYTQYGTTIGTVNAAFAELMASDDPDAWDRMLSNFNERYSFSDVNWDGEPEPGGILRAQQFLRVYGGRQIVHGHTPIFRMSGEKADTITAPLIYAGGLCVNVDAGMYKGGPGFVYELPSLSQMTAG